MNAIRKLAGFVLMSATQLCMAASPALLVIDAQSNKQLTQIQNVDLKKTVVKLKLAPSLSQKLVDVYLDDLSYRADFYKFISGIEVDAATPLSDQAARRLENLARKSTFFSTKLTLSKAEAWRSIFKAEAQNPYLLTTVLGSQAVKQLEQSAYLAKSFATSRVPFVHIFAAPMSKQSANFWQDVAKYHAVSQQPTVYMLLATKPSLASSYQSMVAASLPIANQQMQWVGGDDTKQFKPITMQAQQLTVWRLADNKKVRGFSYQRANSPAGLYAAMGTSQAALTALRNLIHRSQIAANAGISLLADAEDNSHTQQVLANLSASCVFVQGDMNLPVLSNSAVLTRFNMLIDNPSDHAIHKLFYSASVAKPLSKVSPIGLFDYSKTASVAFYNAWHTAVNQNPSFNVTYNTANVDALKLLSTALKGTQVKKVTLGADALRLARSDAKAFVFLNSLREQQSA